MKGICRICKKYKRVRVNYDTGAKTCAECQAKFEKLSAPKEKCVSCGGLLPVTCWSEGKPFCAKCYLREIYYPKKRKCSFCGQPASRGQKIGQRTACEDCFSALGLKKDDCSICGNSRRPKLRTKFGKAMCGSCYMSFLRAYAALAKKRE